MHINLHKPYTEPIISSHAFILIQALSSQRNLGVKM
jgi:hypothetical protein